MDWKEWFFTVIIVITITNVIAISTLPERILGLNIAMLGGIFSGVGFLAWWQNHHEQQSDEMT